MHVKVCASSTFLGNNEADVVISHTGNKKSRETSKYSVFFH